MISSIVNNDNESIVEDFTESVEELAELGLQTAGMSDCSDFPLDFEDKHGSKLLVVDFPLSLDGQAINLDFSERGISVSLPEGSDDGVDFDKQEVKDKVQELLEFPSDVDNSSLSARIEEGSLIVEGDTESESTEEESEEF